MNRLCADTPFARLHIEDIVRESGVSRSNFYHNFEDKYAVVNWIGHQCLRDGIFRIGRDLTWLEGPRITTREMAKFNALFASASVGREVPVGGALVREERQKNLTQTVTGSSIARDHGGARISDRGVSLLRVHHDQQVPFGRASLRDAGVLRYLVASTPRLLYRPSNIPYRLSMPMWATWVMRASRASQEILDR